MGWNPENVAAGDFDNDGWTDLVAVNYDDGDVSVLLNVGGRTFKNQRRSLVEDVTHTARGLVVEDFDHDGRLDLAVHGWYGVVVVLGDGAGRFGPKTRFPTPNSATALTKGDFNADGEVDLASPNRYDSSVSVLLGNGDGTFAAEASFSVGYQPVGVAAVDLDGDGDDDLVVSSIHDPYSQPGTISVLLSNGDGTFAPQVQYGVGRAPDQVAAGDWDGDGAPDLAVGIYEGGFVSVLLGNGDGTLRPEVRYGSSGSYGGGMRAADVDLDGDLDLVRADAQDGVDLVFLGAGDGTFAFGSYLLNRAFATDVVVADLDHDGGPDLVSVGAHHSPILGYGPTGEVTVHWANGPGSWAVAPLEQSRFPAGVDPHDLVTVDLDDDGRLDLIAANFGSDDVSVRLGTAGGAFAPEQRVAAGDGPERLAVADFNEDGDEDLAVFNDLANTVSILLGTGTGGFQAAATLVNSATATDMVAADFGGDGHADVVVAVGTQIAVWRGHGDGTFVPVATPGPGAIPNRMGAGDLNLDGRPDLVYSLPAGVRVQLAVGGEAFASPIAYNTPTGYNLWEIVVGQFNYDAVPDVALTARAGGSTACVLPGMGNGTFFGFQCHSSGLEPRSIAAVDVQGDGVVDLVTANSGSDDVSAIIGEGISFTRQLRFVGGDQPYAIVAGDFDGDGRPDLATANAGTDDISVHLNRGTLPNLPPRAAPLWYSQVDCNSGLLTARLDGSESTDLNSSPGTNDDIVRYDWRYGYPYPFLGSGKILEVVLPAESQSLRLDVVDALGERGFEGFAIDPTFDTRPPDLSVAATPSLLWPPNHRMVPVQATATATDSCGPVTLFLEAVTSNEPDDSPASSDGRTTADVQGVQAGTADLAFQLRAERDGAGPGRTYTVTYGAMDEIGNTGYVSATVTVPHDQAGVTEPLLVSAHQGPAGTWLTWTPAPGAIHYNVIRGEVASIAEATNSVSLGAVQCVAAARVSPDTLGLEDSAAPAAGRAFFYLVEYNDGARSGYGTESAPKPQIPGSGDCP